MNSSPSLEDEMIEKFIATALRVAQESGVEMGRLDPYLLEAVAAALKRSGVEVELLQHYCGRASSATSGRLWMYALQTPQGIADLYGNTQWESILDKQVKLAGGTARYFLIDQPQPCARYLRDDLEQRYTDGGAHKKLMEYVDAALTQEHARLLEEATDNPVASSNRPRL